MPEGHRNEGNQDEVDDLEQDFATKLAAGKRQLAKVKRDMEKQRQIEHATLDQVFGI